MFGMSSPELTVCALVGFFVFGPERLPGVQRDAARGLNHPRDRALPLEDLRQLRRRAYSAASAAIASVVASVRRALSTWRFSIMRPSTVTTP